MAEPGSIPRRTTDRSIALTLVALTPLAVFVGWLAIACYAVAYFISR